MQHIGGGSGVRRVGGSGSGSGMRRIEIDKQTSLALTSVVLRSE